MFEGLDNINSQPAASGKSLIAGPFLDDEYFKRAVVILCEHNEEGSFGFILNNTMSVELNELIEEEFVSGFLVGLGGPVRTDNLYYLHTLGNNIPNSLEVIPGLFMGGDYDIIKAMILEGAITEKDIKFYLGYSGWTPGQLDEELQEDTWIVTDLTCPEIMEVKLDELWKKSLKKLGGKYSVMANFPDDPSLN